jgi:hypothetical protein
MADYEFRNKNVSKGKSYDEWVGFDEDSFFAWAYAKPLAFVQECDADFMKLRYTSRGDLFDLEIRKTRKEDSTT